MQKLSRRAEAGGHPEERRYESLDAVMSGQASAGAFMGRYASRIAGGTFKLDGVEYKLRQNDSARPNTVHGGTKGVRFRVSDVVQVSDSIPKMNHAFTDGEEGFPGTLSLGVTYSLSADGALRVDCSATAFDKKTVFNFTSRPFFSLSNTPEGRCTYLNRVPSWPESEAAPGPD